MNLFEQLHKFVPINYVNLAFIVNVLAPYEFIRNACIKDKAGSFIIPSIHGEWDNWLSIYRKMQGMW